MTKDEALDLALEALEVAVGDDAHDYQKYLDALTAIKQARSAPVQEPSYWLGYGLQAHTEKPFEDATPVWTSPPAAQRQWVGLTDEQIDLFINGRGDEDDDDYVEPTVMYRSLLSSS